MSLLTKGGGTQQRRDLSARELKAWSLAYADYGRNKEQAHGATPIRGFLAAVVVYVVSATHGLKRPGLTFRQCLQYPDRLALSYSLIAMLVVRYLGPTAEGLEPIRSAHGRSAPGRPPWRESRLPLTVDRTDSELTEKEPVPE